MVFFHKLATLKKRKSKDNYEKTLALAAALLLSACATTPSDMSLNQLTQQANKGNAAAQVELGKRYLAGDGVSASDSQAQQWFKQAAAQQDAEGLYQLALTEEPSPASFRHFQQAAELGHTGAQFKTGYYHTFAWLVEAPEDDVEARRWLALAAKKDHGDAQNLLAWMHERGYGGSEDAKAAFDLYVQAANNGSADAQATLGNMYRNGRGVSTNYERAIYWLKKAVANAPTAENFFSLGAAYHFAEGPEQDYAEALKWFQQAADQGIPEAQFNVGLAHYKGQGTPKDAAAAARYYHLAADQGMAEAMLNLGILYYNGEGMSKNYSQAAFWLRKAAEKGDADAQNRLGILYADGHGVRQSFTTALEWLHKAAAQNHSAALYNIGVRYYNGEGVAKNHSTARSWFGKACDSGMQEGCDQYRKLAP